MHKLKFVLLAIIGVELTLTLLIIFVLNELAWSISVLITYDRLTVFIYSMLILLIWNMSTHYKIFKSIQSKQTVNKKLIRSHLIAGILLSVCIAFIVAALSTDDKAVSFEPEDILLGVSIFFNLAIANYLLSRQMKHRNYSGPKS